MISAHGILQDHEVLNLKCMGRGDGDGPVVYDHVAPGLCRIVIPVGDTVFDRVKTGFIHIDHPGGGDHQRETLLLILRIRSDHIVHDLKVSAHRYFHRGGQGQDGRRSPGYENMCFHLGGRLRLYLQLQIVDARVPISKTCIRGHAGPLASALRYGRQPVIPFPDLYPAAV